MNSYEDNEDNEEDLYIGPMKIYSSPWWASTLHNLPHLDLNLEFVKKIFNLEDAKYREALMFWAAMPILLLLLTLFGFLIYFCYRCCRRDTDKPGKITCLKWSMGIITLICCASIGLGLYGNEDVNKGVVEVTNSANDMLDTLIKIKKQVILLQRTYNVSLSKGIESTRGVINSHKELNHSLIADMQTNMLKSSRFAKDIYISVADLQKHSKKAEGEKGYWVKELYKYENFRRFSLLGFFGFLLLLCFLLLVGVGSLSRCMLLVFCAFGIFSLVLCWILAGLLLATGVAFGDFCSSPDEYLESTLVTNVETNILQYYMKCDITLFPSPFREALKSSQDNLNEVDLHYSKVIDVAYRHISKNELTNSVQKVQTSLDECRSILLTLTALIECTHIYKDYWEMLHGVCYVALPGILFMCLSCCVCGLLITILVVLASKAWRVFGMEHYSNGLPKPYTDEDEEGPFLGHNVTTSPTYYSRVGIKNNDPHSQSKNRSNNQQAYNRKSTPPPAYNSNEFYRQYSDVNTLDDRRGQYAIRESNA